MRMIRSLFGCTLALVAMVAITSISPAEAVPIDPGIYSAADISNDLKSSAAEVAIVRDEAMTCEGDPRQSARPE